ncbi:restriction endonuclease subunit S [Lactobacillus amylovorus]|uniref:restriction endonuclease subunit S n=1 Tax=Lactobacillus amylovorus TaxID=1604 RepID=UPI002242DB68|nr:restriction endonuclease subunit S [Lactobacillus amylovorus]
MKTNTLDFDAQALRERILDLAMRGKLVPQDPNDEPASTLLKSCDLKSANEQPHVIPRSWEWIVLGSAVKFINGRAYKKAELLEDKSLTPVLRVGNLFTNSSWYYSDLQLDLDKYIDNGDLIYAWSASFGPRIWDGGHVIYHYHIWKLVLDQVVDKNYLYYFLLDKRNVIGETDLHGSTMKHITKTNMEHLSFPLPPLIEQQRIAAKIAQLFALLRKVETSTRQYAALQTLLKSKVLDLAMRGKLVKQDPNDESASVLLEKIKADTATRIANKQTKKIRMEKHSGEENLKYKIPDNWTWTRLGYLIYKLSDGAHRTPKYISEGIPFLSVKDMSKGKIEFENCKYISKEDHARLYERCNPEKGDILLSKVGTTGVPALVETEKKFDLFVSIALLKFNHTYVDQNYLKYLIESPIVQIQAERNTRGVGNKNWVLRDIAGTVVPLPPISEQKRIVSKIKQLSRYCD